MPVQDCHWRESLSVSIEENLIMLTFLTIFISLHTLSQCFLLNAFGIENITETDIDILQEEPPETNYNAIIEKTQINSFENKMEEKEKPQHLPFFVVLRQSGTKNRKGVASSSIREGL